MTAGYKAGTVVSLVGMLAAGLASAQEPAVTAFVNVAVIPMDRERVLPNQTVLVRGDRIVALGPAAKVRVPAGARSIDGHGKFLLPGLADMHSHVRTTDDAGLFVYLANGVTTIRDMGGREGLAKLQERRANGALMPPRLYGVTRTPDCRTTPLRDCFAALKARGIDMLKFLEFGADRAWFDSIVAAAKQVQLPVGGHAQPGPGIEWALQVPYKSIEHLYGYLPLLIGPSFRYPSGMSFDPAIVDTVFWMQPTYRLDPQKLRDLAVRTRRAGSWNAPTTAAFDSPSESDSTRSARAMRRQRDFHLQIVKALHEAGAGLLLAADMLDGLVGGYAVHRELELLVQAGLTPYQALVTGTRDIAVYLGTQDSAGTVAVGKQADLVLLERNPLTDIRYMSRPAGVMAAGRWFPRTEIETRLDTLDAEHCYLADLRRQASQHLGIKVRRNHAGCPGSP